MTEHRLLHALLHPVAVFRDYQAALADRADAEAAAAGLTVEVLPNGVHRYRDPRLDLLAAHRGGDSDASEWSPVRLASAGGWVADTAGPAAPANHMPDRLRRAEPSAGAGAVPAPTVPHQGRSGCASASLRDRLAAALDPGHPAAPVPDAPAGRREEHAPARLPSGPAITPGGAR